MGLAFKAPESSVPVSVKRKTQAQSAGDNWLREGLLAADLPPPCDSDIYCTGDILKHVQLSKIFNEDKEFVDMVLLDIPGQCHSYFFLAFYAKNKTMVFYKNNNDFNTYTSYLSARVKKKFQTLLQSPPRGNVTRDQLIDFLQKNFNASGSELEQWNPPDWNESPKFISLIHNSELQKWASDLNALWKSLGRKIKEEVKNSSDRYSMIYLPNPMVVPGGRFREIYYWDSYWVINGLLLSEMNNTAKGMIENFLHLVKSYGMIPNGGRIYYLRRSQPPFLTLMMESYMAKVNDVTFLRENIQLLAKEYDFWMNNRSVSVTHNGNNYTMNRYYVPVGGPRPEAYSKDYELAENLMKDAQQALYSELKAAAESGWDFSSRWFHGSTGTLADTKTNSIIPVDLNAILCRVERTLAKFYTDLGMEAEATRFSDALKKRLEAVQAVLWDDCLGVWLDYNLETNARNSNFYPSNISPLWASCFSDNSTVDRVVSYLEKSGALLHKNGLPASYNPTGEQWDFPNGWPPLQHMVIEGLEKTNSTKAKEIAFSLAQKWVHVNYEAYKKYNAMFEKYDVEGDGKPGGGGEYDVQLGFGWSNGVIMQLFDLYQARLSEVTNSAISTSVSLSTLLLLPISLLTLWA
ncbi:trehalase [Gastrophryne carolinensis]